MKDVESILKGLLAAAAMPPIMNAAWDMVIHGLSNLMYWPLLLIVYIYSLTLAALLGMPLFFIARHYDLVRWWTALLSGIIAGAIFAAMYRYPGSMQANDFFPLCADGAAAALVFWAVWKKGVTLSPGASADTADIAIAMKRDHEIEAGDIKPLTHEEFRRRTGSAGK